VDLNEDDSDAVIDLSQEENDSQAEEEEEEEEGDPNEFVDVLDIVDGRAELGDGSDNESPGLSHRESTRKDQDVESDNIDEDDDDSAEQPLDQGISSDDEVENPTALEDLDAFISNLEVTAKRKIADEEEPLEPPDNSRIKKRKVLKERTEAGVESEFAAGKSSGM
jgi:U3 small nucleolar RNA-associated protein 14